MSTAEKLVRARGLRSREMVAEAVGVSVSAIGMYETGARVPRDEIKVRLADYFETSVQSLFFDEGVTNRDPSGASRNKVTTVEQNSA